MRVWKAAAAVAVVAIVGGVLYGVFGSTQPVRIDPADRAQVDLGRKLYVEACASCHGANLEGQPNWQKRLPNGRLPAPPHDASGHTWHHPDIDLFRVTKLGPAAYPTGYETDMPAFGDRLSDAEIAAILAYIKSTWPPEIRARHDRLNAAKAEGR
ncbi:MAG: cytochrome c [Reyranella sp.]|uniref:c-type cytochrome n=1 Tax=Reyranella sp. TaxID=1929291 RepID=UPI0025F46811|nr:cytochrome c [Reyranella sp.]MBR2818538.1 cytochrome c [Reyranella sp.]